MGVTGTVPASATGVTGSPASIGVTGTVPASGVGVTGSPRSAAGAPRSTAIATSGAGVTSASGASALSPQPDATSAAERIKPRWRVGDITMGARDIASTGAVNRVKAPAGGAAYALTVDRAV